MHVKIYSHFEGGVWEDDVKDPPPLLDDRAMAEWLFRYFNCVTEQDVERLAAIGYNLPSLSVYDEIEFHGGRWRVEAVGFRDLGPVQPESGEAA